MYSTDPADLFSQLYDELDERLFARDEEAEMWLDDDSVREIAAEVEHEVVTSGRLSGETVERFLDVVEVDRNRFAILLGLDQAFLQADLIAGSYDEAWLVELTLRYLETGRYSTDGVRGAVLPKLVVPGQEHLLPESLREAFVAVIRVPPESPVPVEHIVLDDWLSRTVREAGLFVAALPAFDASADLLVKRMDVEPAAYRIRLVDTGDELDRVRAFVDALDQTEGILALLPEIALTPTLLSAWQQVCAAYPPPIGARLTWIVVGSGPEHNDSDRRPHNRAVVIERATGRIVWFQDKQYRFPLTDELIRRWNLQKLGKGPVEEWITVGGELRVVETPGLRTTVLICEDMTQLDTVGTACRDWGVSLALCPIFSQAMRKFRWERNHAAWLHQAVGVQTVVCNSQYVGDVEPEENDPVGDVLAVGVAVELAPQQHAAEPVLVRLTEHGVFIVQ